MKVTDYLPVSEIKALTATSDWMGWKAVLFDYGAIAAALALVGAYPHPLTVLLAMIVSGGRQLGLAILVHETTHRTLFRTRWLNDFAGRWICGGPIWQDLPRYREHHMKHHQLAGSESDPDYSLVASFPTSKRSLGRKLLRDVSGITGIKRLYGLLLMDAGMITYTVAADPKPVDQTGRKLGEFLATTARNIAPMIVANGLLLALLFAIRKPALYLLWIGSYLTTFSVFLRIRSIAEHACTGRGLDPLQSTRTTRANFLARLTVAPHRVNFHLEHHILRVVPYFNLPKLHQEMKSKSAYEAAFIAEGYAQVLKTAVTETS